MADPKGFMLHTRQAPKLKPVDERLQHHDEHYEVFSEEQVRTQASRCMDCGVPFCMTGCPLGNLIPEWNDMAYRGRWEQAIRALHATNNFPEFTGRVCPAPCENSCVLGINEPAVTIKLHEMTIIDHAFESGLMKPNPPKLRTGKTVAVIGGGPAGLACAAQLNKAGHTVTVYEKNDRAGGLLMYGIPHYKLRKEKVQRRIDLLAAEGIEFVYSCEVGKDVTADELKTKHDAVVLATGAEHPRDLPVDGREGDGVHFAMEFLPQQNKTNWGDDDIAALHPDHKVISAKGKKVIVIGGGDTGSDCIGTSLRQGATSVTNFELLGKPGDERSDANPWPQWARIYRRSSSVEEMEENGGAVHYNIMTTRFFRDENGTLIGLETADVDWSNGRPEQIAGSEKRWDCDLVLLAMGFLGPKQGLVEQFGLETDQRSNIKTDANKMCSVEGVFAAGDCRRGQSLVVWGIAEGRDTARCVDEYLTGKPSLLPEVKTTPFQY